MKRPNTVSRNKVFNTSYEIGGSGNLKNVEKIIILKNNTKKIIEY